MLKMIEDINVLEARVFEKVSYIVNLISDWKLKEEISWNLSCLSLFALLEEKKKSKIETYLKELNLEEQINSTENKEIIELFGQFRTLLLELEMPPKAYDLRDAMLTNDLKDVKKILKRTPKLITEKSIFFEEFGYPIHYACYLNNISGSMIHQLMEGSEKLLSIKCSNGLTPPEIAVCYSNLNTIFTLEKYCPELKNNDQEYLLYNLIKTKQLEALTTLLSFNTNLANQAAKKHEFSFPLHYACYIGDLKIFKTLVKFGAKLDTFDSKYKLPVDVAESYKKQEIKEFLKFYYSKITNIIIWRENNFFPEDVKKFILIVYKLILTV